MSLNTIKYRNLIDLIDKQINLYEEYLKFQEKEREALKSAKIKDLKECTISRSNILELIMVLKSKIGEILSEEGENKISKLLNKYGTPEQKRQALMKVKKLRYLVKCTQGRAREYSELLDFSSNFINGSLSILWSATQGIFKSYGRDGAIHESYHPEKFIKDRTL